MQLLLSLGLPSENSLELQIIGKYLGFYMNNLPWFNELGSHSELDVFVKG